MAITQSDRERIASFRYMDDEFMTACSKNNIDAVELVIRIILNEKDIRVQSVTVQDTLKNLFGRSTRLVLMQ